MKKFDKLGKYTFFFFFLFFLIQYKITSFYINRFGDILNFVDFNKPNIYEQINMQHPYWEIYKMTQKAIEEKKPIYKYFDKKEEKFVDYSTILYRRTKNNKLKDDEKYYLREPEVYLNYYFYPYTVEEIGISKILKRKIREGFLISDKDLINAYPRLKQFLKPIPKKNKDYVLINWKKESDYFIYEIKYDN